MAKAMRTKTIFNQQGADGTQIPLFFPHDDQMREEEFNLAYGTVEQEDNRQNADGDNDASD